MDEESWFEAIKGSEFIKQSGAWYTLVYDNGEEQKFQATKWMSHLQDQRFRQRVEELMDIEVIGKYKDRIGDIESFENVDKDVES